MSTIRLGQCSNRPKNDCTGRCKWIQDLNGNFRCKSHRKQQTCSRINKSDCMERDGCHWDTNTGCHRTMEKIRRRDGEVLEADDIDNHDDFVVYDEEDNSVRTLEGFKALRKMTARMEVGHVASSKKGNMKKKTNRQIKQMAPKVVKHVNLRKYQEDVENEKKHGSAVSDSDDSENSDSFSTEDGQFHD